MTPPRAATRQWPEYAMEAAGLGLFMISAATMATVIEHPSSPVRAWAPALIADLKNDEDMLRTLTVAKDAAKCIVRWRARRL